MKPERIQRKRTRGWRMPKGSVYVGRPTKWGNPFTTLGNDKICLYYECWLLGYIIAPWLPESPLADIEELRGKDLVCWCDLNDSCHADVLLKYANR